MLFATYLLVAMTSYLFTWKSDQDLVLRLSWDFLWNSDVRPENWLGRLGAVLSNAFIYYGFGLASFLFVWMFGALGYRLFYGGGLKKWALNLRVAFISLVILSIGLEFIFASSGFPWGGSFGQAVVHWLTNFMGQVGVLLLLIALTVGYFIWLFNPEMKETSLKQLFSNFNWSLSSATVEDNLDLNRENISKVNESEEAEVKTLRPSTEKAETDEERQTSLDLDWDKNEIDLKPKEPLTADTSIGSEDDSKQLEISTVSIRAEKSNVEEESEGELQPYDPTLDLSHYRLPPLELLNDYKEDGYTIDREELEENKNQIIRTLLNYKIEITKIRATIGPTVTLYEIVPAPGIRISKIKNLEDDIALSLSALGIRIIAPIPGKGTIGIEVPNKKKQIVALKDILNTEKFVSSKMDLPIALGKTIANEPFIADLAKMPHLLIAGATGQGKSVGINAVLTSILYKMHPSQVKLVLVDPKKVELFLYSKIAKHFLACLPDAEEPIITDTKKVVNTLNSLCIEMDTRYNQLKQARARNIKEYNRKFVNRELNPNKGHKYLPFIVLVIDEFADLIMTAGKEIEMPIGRLAQLARAVGIHLVIATQRPSVNIITGIIKANFPARIAYKVTSKVDSRTILDHGGAEQLIGRGDMLLSVGGNMIRLQCAFIDTPEVEDILKHIAAQQSFPEPYYLPEYISDEDPIDGTGYSASELDDMFPDAARLIVAEQYGSTSMIQRKLKLGYNRAGRLMDQLEAFGIVGPAQGSKPRQVLIFSESELETVLNGIKSSA